MNPTGTLYGVGVGPGDPELITQKAVRIIRQCPVIAAPQTGQARQVAFGIASQAVENLDQKTILALPFPMVKDAEVLSKTRDELAAMLETPLREGKDVAFLTLGDPTIYSTYWYLHQRIQQKGIPTQFIPGVPSFCAAAACLDLALVEADEPLHVLPASYAVTEEALALPGTKVLMKMGRSLEETRETLRKQGLLSRAMLVQNCGLPGEAHLPGLGKRTARSQLLFDDCDKGGASMIHFVGAGPGAPDLITLRGHRLLCEADVIIYAGSLVNPALLDAAKEGCAIHNSACMTLEEVLAVMEQAEREQKTTVRLHTGDPCLYGAIQEQMDALRQKGIPYAVTPGVSSFCAAAAALPAEYTLPGVSQTVILTRMAGRTPVPEREEIAGLAAHGASMAIFLSAGDAP